MTVTRVQPGDVIVREGPFTKAERDAIPDNGCRHELLDGVLVMTPAPRAPHQDIVAQLMILLHRSAPRWAKVMIAPFDVVLGDQTVLEPDVIVARRADVTEENLPGAPLLRSRCSRLRPGSSISVARRRCSRRPAARRIG